MVHVVHVVHVVQYWYSSHVPAKTMLAVADFQVLCFVFVLTEFVVYYNHLKERIKLGAVTTAQQKNAMQR